MKKLGVYIPIFLTIVLAFSIIGNVSAQPAAGDYIVTEFTSNELSKVTPGGIITLITGGLSSPVGVAIDGSGNYIVAEWGSNELSKVTPGGIITLITDGLTKPESVAIVPETNPVGGIYAPTGKLTILTPYIALVGLIGALSSIFAIRRWRKD